MWSPILKPVDFNKNEPVWVITDGSWKGIGAMYSQGKDWDTCQPAGFLWKKFMSTQHNYCMHKHETLAVLEALMKWEDKLLGRMFTVVTDHKGLEYFKTQPNSLPRQTRWWEYISHFNYTTHLSYIINQESRKLIGNFLDTIISYPKYHSNGFVTDNYWVKDVKIGGFY